MKPRTRQVGGSYEIKLRIQRSKKLIGGVEPRGVSLLGLRALGMLLPRFFNHEGCEFGEDTSAEIVAANFPGDSPASIEIPVNGYDVVKGIEAVGSQSGKTSAKVTISDCGKVE